MSCMMLPRHQVHTGICHCGSAQLHSPHYPLWTRTDVISLSVTPPSPLPLPFPLPVSLLHHFSLLLPFCLPTSLSIFVPSWFFSSCFFAFCPTLHPSPSFSPSLSPSVLHSLSILCLSACGLISLVYCCCCFVTEPTRHTWFGWLG